MVEIRIEQESLDLLPGFSIDFEYNNPMFTFDSIEGSFSFPVDFPLTENNKKILNHSHYITVRDKIRIYDCEAAFRGLVFIFGKLVILSSGTDGWRASVSVNRFPLEILDKRIKDIDYGVINMGDDSAEVAQEAYNRNVAPFRNAKVCFPTWRNSEFYGDLNPDFIGFCNVEHPSVTKLQHNNVVDGVPQNKYNLVPWINAKFLFERIFEDIGYMARGPFMDDAEFDKLAIFSNRSMDTPLNLAQFFVKVSQAIANIEFIAFPATLFLDPPDYAEDADADNIYKITLGGDPGYEIQTSGQHTIKIRTDLLHDHAPAVSTTFEIRISLDQFSAEEIRYTQQFTVGLLQTAVIDISVPLTFSASDIGKSITVNFTGTAQNSLGQEIGLINVKANNGVLEITNDTNRVLNEYKQTLIYADYLPDITVGQFILGIAQFPHLQYKFDTLKKQVIIDFADRIIKDGKVKNLTGKTEPEYVIDFHQAGFTFTWNITDNDKKGADSNNFLPHIIGDGETQVNPLVTPLMITTGPVEGNSILCPFNFEPGISDTFPTGQENTEFRMAFFHNRQPGSVRHYPLATNHVFGFNGAQIGQYSLRWADPVYGLAKKFWQKFVNMIGEGNQVTRNVVMNAEDVHAVDFNEKTRIEQAEFIVKKLTIGFSHSGIKKGKSEFFKIV